MYADDHHTEAKYGATRQSWSRLSVRTVYAEIKASNPTATHSALIRLMANRMRDDGDVLLAAADYIVTNCAVAEADYKRRKGSPSSASTRERVTATVEAIKDQIMLLNLEMPNGKRMRFCTGTEMGKFGAAYQRIAKKVGTKLVGSVLSEQNVRALMEPR